MTFILKPYVFTWLVTDSVEVFFTHFTSMCAMCDTGMNE